MNDKERITYQEWLKRNPDKRINPTIKGINNLVDTIFPDVGEELDSNADYDNEIDIEDIPF